MSHVENASHVLSQVSTVAESQRDRPRAVVKSGSGSFPVACQRSTVGLLTRACLAIAETFMTPDGRRGPRV